MNTEPDAILIRPTAAGSWANTAVAASTNTQAPNQLRGFIDATPFDVILMGPL